MTRSKGPPRQHHGRLSKGHWEKLDEILTPIYGEALPDISAALDESFAKETFEGASGFAAPPSNSTL